jgi:uncharacterized protein YlxP (DUF503 family)
MSGAMFVGVVRVSLRIEHSHSLKDKRAVVRRLRDRVAQQFGVALREVDGADTWQRADLGFAVCARDRAEADETLRRVIGFIAAHGQGELAAVRREVLAFGDDWFAAAAPWSAAPEGPDASWAPPEWLDEKGDS